MDFCKHIFISLQENTFVGEEEMLRGIVSV